MKKGDLTHKFFLAALRLGQPRVYKYYRFYDKTQWYDQAALRDLELKRLQEIVTFAYEHTVFYKNKFTKAGVKPSDLKSLEDIQKFPLTTKEELKDALKAGEVGSSEEKIVMLKTTGSSGVPFIFPINEDGKAERMGGFLRTIEWYGHFLGARNARFWRTGTKDAKSTLLQNVFGRRLELSIYNVEDPENSVLSPERVDQFLLQLNKFKPAVIDGYVSSFVYMAQYIIDHKIEAYSPESIVTGAEYLSNESRELIEKAFQCPVYNRYGGTEIGLMAHECAKKGMHIMSDKAYGEVVMPDGTTAPSGVLGDIVYTDFTDRALPFIRYKVGDRGIAEDPTAQCECGRSLPMFRSIEGRINDLMPLQDGTVLVTHLWFKLFREFEDKIRQFQVIQEDLDLFRVNVVLEYPEADLSELHDQVKQFVRGGTVHWEVVQSIVPGKGGKLRHTISEVPYELNANRDTVLRESPIEILDVASLKAHEEVDEDYVVQLAEEVSADNLVKKPLLVDAKTHTILDGHHRYRVAQRLGLKRLPAVTVDYMSTLIHLEPFRDDNLTKQMVLDYAGRGQLFPYKTTKHVFGEHHLPVIQCLPEANVPLDKLT
ncbi:MAG: hypothetical protein COW24_03625 [Candidatus Kerfeldbacteria bacterium CG15_BIG_FIL_POST_REV_8_21_14_020_45_12]|uniref:ParB-like N-terminal domain-containing protein n=1 Tax=Candidatus Kerfeldbacteria bacterium CG15_BIG_FIL_POST_REV_8_21_14_020_45_12 TaxID=2014247 RepID=A0A2M7H3D6_9BACT|nr:MAG: hypothetical protein COW24_03625 [Candidatus Kerfeldbacteria bacterium CG15_BIG_FIL_POST_REV_8_21_14_020_45_12]PJA93759.1 MAG: hypothetical protein CO132_01820 [Candidatus Kerfeldbacteria bacterium CG_4_9_14_3_um_filter_45_8]